MTLLVRVFLAWLAAVAALPAAAWAQPDRTREIFQRHAEAAGFPGAALVVVRGGQVAHRLTGGVCREGEPMSTTTPLLIGSLSKPLTAEAAARLAAADKLDLDAAIPGRPGLTSRMLLDQRSGFTRDQGFGVPAPGTQAWSALTPLGVHGDYAYSNLNYVLLGDVLAKAAGRPFPSLMQETVFEPLGMTTASAGDRAAARCGHQLAFGFILPRAEPAWPEHAIPAGFMSASAEDLGRFLLAKLAQDKQRPLAVDPDQYARGWRHDRLGEDRVFWHSGSSGSFRASMVLLPDRDLGFVVLTNMGGWMVEDPVDDLSVALLAHYRGETPAPPRASVERWVRLGISVLLLVVVLSTVVRLFRTPDPAPGRLVGMVIWTLLLVGLPFGLKHMTGIGPIALWRLAPDLAAAMIGIPLMGLLGATVAFIRVGTRSRKA